MRKNTEFHPDASQQRVIEAEGGYHLVLAPPGCGKTQILTERIRRAHERDGVPYSEMLCLTFTNRAARGMVERIQQNIDDSEVAQVYVGNVHRFCSKFLFENNLLPAETSIIDEEDAVSIVARYLDEDEMQVMENAVRRREYFDIIHFSHFMRQIRSRQPRELRLHPESCNADDVVAMQKICEVQRMDFNAETMLDIYDNPDFYLSASRSDGYDLGAQALIDRLLRKMTVAAQYEDYKRENHLVDFEDLLIMAYDALKNAEKMAENNLENASETRQEYKKYRWIQVDEVQDLNPLQLAIVDLITEVSPNHSSPQSGEGTGEGLPFTVMYLGDEQQAIFSFMGARLSTLNALRQRCEGNIHHLSTNHRSPQYLLEVFNTYARMVLGIDPALLPQARKGQDLAANEEFSGEKPAFSDEKSSEKPSEKLSEKLSENPLRILRSNTLDTEYYDVAHMAQLFASAYPDETTAIIVNANTDADRISAELRQLQQAHFKVSGEDIFASKEVKLLLAHLNVLANEHNFIAWARLLKGFGVTATNAYARNFVQSLRQRAMLPSDFLAYDDSTYLEEFAKAFDSGEIVVFDTETTGLDILHDDIVQIAAVRLRQGEVVEGSQFNIFLQTERPIPEKLGDLDNPILEELRHHEQLPPAEGLQRFLDYIGTSPVLGHNVTFDWQIFRNNCHRHGLTPILRRPVFDSLKLIRLLEPDLKQYKLKFLLEMLHLEGENSHLADADVAATCSLVRHCREKAETVLPQQREFRRQQRVKDRAEALRRQYRDFFTNSVEKMYLGDTETPLTDEFQRFHDYLTEAEIIQPVEKLHYITRYLADELIDPSDGHSLAQQLAAHIVEINTLKEADLCNSQSLDDRIFVTTVHKAKGLEFDNVIVFDAVEDRYPSYFNRNNPVGLAEDARKFYVAITRTRKRLYIAQCLTRLDFHNNPRPRQLTRFMNPIQKFFG